MTTDAYYDKYNEEIDEKNNIYKNNIDDWKLYGLSYKGGDEFIEYSLHKHDRESYANHVERQNEGICFNYSSAIIDLFNFYLTEKPSSREFEAITLRGRKNPKQDSDIKNRIKRSIGQFDKKDTQWLMFLQDADLHNKNFDVFLNHTQKIASIYGSAGILISKPNVSYQTRAEEIKNRVYPFVTVFRLPDIYDWEFTRNINSGRFELSYLKLKESDTEYLIWFKSKWERWQKIENETKLIDSGENPLGEIPFVWVPNITSLDSWYIGESDIKEISRISASIIRNISCGEEMLKFCGFPMLVLPKEAEGYDTDDGEEDQPSGPRAVLEKDPEYGTNGSPEWLEPQILDATEANLAWTDRKVDEIYRIAHLSGVHGQRKSNNEVASGLALRYEFQQLNSVLLQKAQNLSEAELQVIKYWLKWQNHGEMIDNITVTRPKSFSVDELALDIDNLFSAISEIPSEHFKKLALKHISLQMLPDMKDADIEKVTKEIDKNAKLDKPEAQSASQKNDPKKKDDLKKIDKEE